MGFRLNIDGPNSTLWYGREDGQGGWTEVVDTATAQTITGSKNIKGTARGVTTATTATNTLPVTKSGMVYVATAASGTQAYTLPKATLQKGMFFTFVCGNAAGEINILGDAADTFNIKATGDGGAAIASVATTGVKNTGATNVLGDHITLVSDGTSAWWTIAQSGIWASL